MKNSFGMIGVLSLFSLACSSPTPSNSQTNSLPKPEVKNDDLPKITSKSYILAEPLAGKKLRLTITAKDQDLYISNCSGSFPISLTDKTNPQNYWTEVVTTCRSDDIIIPKGTTLVVERQITGSHFPVNMNVTYQASIALSYNPYLKNHEISDEKRLSNPFKLVP